MAQRWKKPPREGHITEHFAWRETTCRHCGKVPEWAAVEATAVWMEEIREILGDRVIHVTSWCRCKLHNQNVGGAVGSLHMQGIAVDFTVRGLSPRAVQKILKQHQGVGKLIGGLGSYPSWTHADRGKPRTWNGP